MLILSSTTDTIQVVLNAAHTSAALQCVASYRDITTTAYTPGRVRTTTNGTTDVSLVTAPGASTQRVVDFLSVYNSDTGAKTVTIKYDDNGTEAILWKGSVAVGEKVEYTDGKGFTLFDLNGIQKVTSVQSGAAYVASTLNVVTLASDVTNNNGTANTMADVTGLSFAVNANETYYFKFVIFYTSAATATGSRWSINGPVSPTLLSYRSKYTLTATTETTNFVLAYDSPAASNATSLTTGNIAIIEGHIRPSAAGTVVARFASEVASSAIVAKAGSYCEWVRTL